MLKCDWLSFTFKPDRLPYLVKEQAIKKIEKRYDPDVYFKITDFEIFLEVFPEIAVHYGDFVVVENARYYHRRHVFNDSIYIRDDDNYKGQKGVNVEIPSHGLYLIKEWFRKDVDTSLEQFFELLFSRGCTLSRFDCCADIPVADSPVKPIDFLYWSSTGQIKSHYRNLEGVSGNLKDFIIKTMRDGQGGATFYLGDRRHQMLRIYDKNVESKGENPSIRFEIEAHREKAQRIAEAYIQHQFSFVDLFLDMIDVVKYYDANNRSRVERDPQFEELISCLRKCSSGEMFIPPKKTPPTLASRINWARHIYNSILELEYISPEFHRYLDRLRTEFIPSKYAVQMKYYIDEFEDYTGKEVPFK